MKFSRHIGISYSGASSATTPSDSLRVFDSRNGRDPAMVGPGRGASWTRKELAEWLKANLLGPERIAVALGHAFSFPEPFLARMAISSWDELLVRFKDDWRTHERPVEEARQDAGEWVAVESELFATRHKLRLCERWTSSAKSVLHYRGAGSVYHSVRAGLPFLLDIRNETNHRAHFWPFDGFDVPAWKSLVAEVFPPMLRPRYEKDLPLKYNRSKHRSHILDAYSACKWLVEKDCNGFLENYLSPMLTEDEKQQVMLEGWILGVL